MGSSAGTNAPCQNKGELRGRGGDIPVPFPGTLKLLKTQSVNDKCPVTLRSHCPILGLDFPPFSDSLSGGQALPFPSFTLSFPSASKARSPCCLPWHPLLGPWKAPGPCGPLADPPQSLSPSSSRPGRLLSDEEEVQHASLSALPCQVWAPVPRGLLPHSDLLPELVFCTMCQIGKPLFNQGA
jgi:hypothetical protein